MAHINKSHPEGLIIKDCQWCSSTGLIDGESVLCNSGEFETLFAQGATSFQIFCLDDEHPECPADFDVDDCGICTNNHIGLNPIPDTCDDPGCGCIGWKELDNGTCFKYVADFDNNVLNRDCNGDCLGTAFIDDCGCCVRGLTQPVTEESPTQCWDWLNEEFISAPRTLWNEGFGLNENWAFDCDGQCFTGIMMDQCDVCGGCNECDGCTNLNADNYDSGASGCLPENDQSCCIFTNYNAWQTCEGLLGGWTDTDWTGNDCNTELTNCTNEYNEEVALKTACLNSLDDWTDTGAWLGDTCNQELTNCDSYLRNNICNSVAIPNWGIAATGTDTCNTLNVDCTLDNLINGTWGYQCAVGDRCACIGETDACWDLNQNCSLQNAINSGVECLNGNECACINGDACYTLDEDCSLTNLINSSDGTSPCSNGEPCACNGAFGGTDACYTLDENCEVGNIGYPDIYIYGSLNAPPNDESRQRPEYVAYHLNKECSIEDAIAIIGTCTGSGNCPTYDNNIDCTSNEGCTFTGPDWENEDTIAGPETEGNKAVQPTQYFFGAWGTPLVFKVNGGYVFYRVNELTFRWNENCTEVT